MCHNCAREAPLIGVFSVQDIYVMQLVPLELGIPLAGFAVLIMVLKICSPSRWFIAMSSGVFSDRPKKYVEVGMMWGPRGGQARKFEVWTGTVIQE